MLDTGRLFNLAGKRGTRSKGWELAKLKLELWCTFLRRRDPAPWNSFPREAADPPSRGLFTSRLGVKDAPVQPQVADLRQASRGEILRPVLSRMSDEIIVTVAGGPHAYG